MDRRFPAEIADWIGDALLGESSGMSGAHTLYVAREGGAYLKIAPLGSLARAAQMQGYFAEKGLSARMLAYASDEAHDYLLVQAVPGKNGISHEHLQRPEWLSGAFGEALRMLHGTDAADCPRADALEEMLAGAEQARYDQRHLDMIAPHIGPAKAERAGAEIVRKAGVVRRDVLLHGDYCLPNIMLFDGRWQGFIDVVDGGLGDRHYDLAWGLWTLRYNLQDAKYGARFLDAYGRDALDARRLRVCGLLAAQV